MKKNLLPQGLFSGISGVFCEPLVLEEPLTMVRLAARTASMEGTVALLSGGPQDLAQFHFLAFLPRFRFVCFPGEIRIYRGTESLTVKGDPLEFIRQVLKRYDHPRVEWTGPGADFPVTAGLFGYLAYDLKDALEELPKTSVDDLHLPVFQFILPQALVVEEAATGRQYLCLPRWEDEDLKVFEERRRSVLTVLGQNESLESFFVDKNLLSSTFTREQYEETVNKVRTHITNGDVYQINLSQRFNAPFLGDPFSLFRSLYEKNPAPFYAYMNGADHQLLCTSPERFVLRRGARVEARPIKGTRPRGRTPEEDGQLRQELLESKKDAAELSMIVDLLRNDLGKVCRAGTVVVEEHKKIDAYQNVFHLVSTVAGQMEPDLDTADILAAAFPGGSITGCPKVRAMEIIDTLEPVRRHIYTGSLGYLGFHDTLDLNIAIRTATIHKNRIFFSVGGGIVYDSDPHEEYLETLHKGKTFLDIIAGQDQKTPDPPAVWLDGHFRPEASAAVPVLASGVQHGWGFFETLRADRGHLYRLDQHLARLKGSWEALMSGPFPDIDWELILKELIKANHLEKGPARLKIGVFKGTPGGWPEVHLFAGAWEYRTGSRNRGIRLGVYPFRRSDPLAGIKTTSYLYCALAARWAGECGFDEALLLDEKGLVLESNTAGIACLQGKRIILPSSSNLLPGIVVRAAAEILEENGYTREYRDIFLDDLAGFDGLLLCNSLMGAVPVLELEGKKLFLPEGGLIEMVNRRLFYHA